MGMTSILAGTAVLVEVHGLPANKVESFTYQTDRDLEIGQLVLVPAPDWSVKVTGRAELPGFVLGESEEELGGIILRHVIPEPAHPRASVPGQANMRDLVEQWRHEADSLSLAARNLQDQSTTINEKAADLEMALDGELGF